jgi:aspartate/methionine/tyrosine aminotransferase
MDFQLERYFARWEFGCKHLLCSSDLESWAMSELLAMADADSRTLWDKLTLGYTQSAGHPVLRAEIARRYAGMDADDIHCFAGAEEAIAMLITALVDPGQHVVVVRPAYQSLFEIARSRGAEVSEIWLRQETGFRLDFDALRAAMRPNTRMVIVNFPHNPTGISIDERSQVELVRLTDAHGAFLLSDEVYRGLEHDPASKLPAAVTLSRRAFSLGAMAKSYGLAGLRLGWLAIRDDAVRQRVAALKDYGSMCNSAPSEILALIALRAEARVMARGRAIVDTNLPLLKKFVDGNAHRLSWVPPTGGVTAFPRFRDDGFDVDAFCERLVRDTGVLLLPGSKYGVKAPHFRIGFGRRDFPTGLAVLERYLSRG